MTSAIKAGLLLAGGAMALTLACAGANAQGAGPFKLTSTTFKDGEFLPKKSANMNAPGAATPNPNCVGENVSPQFSWTGAPAETKSYVMLMIDPEGRGGAGVHHWVAYGIPKEVTSFAEGETSKESPKYVGGKSTQGVGNYSGPCTPPGTPHHYTFVMIATDFEPKELPPGMTMPEVWAKLPGRGKVAAGMVGLFVKPQ